MNKNVTVTIEVPEDVVLRGEALAKRLGLTFSVLVSEALADFEDLHGGDF